MNNITRYKDISFAQKIDKSKVIKVVLSKYKAFLFCANIRMQKQAHKKTL